MERCKYCGEVLEYGAKFCHACGKTTEKEPSKRFLKKKAKEDAFVVNNDARLYRISYRLFGTLFFIASLILFAFYGQYFFFSIGKLDMASKFVETIDKAFNINTKVNEFLPFFVMFEKKLGFLFVFYGVALILSIFSLFTKKRASLGATMYKLSAIVSVSYLIFDISISTFLSDFEITEQLYKIILYSCGGLALFFFVIGFIASFNFKNPYRATWYQGFKALYFLVPVVCAVLLVLLNEVPEIVMDIIAYTTYNPPIYIFVASLLLFIGSKYRGNIEKLV